MIHVYPDVTTRIKRDLGSRFARHCHIQPIKQRETPLAIVNLGQRIPFAVAVEALFTFPQSRCDRYCREVWTSPWWVTRTGFPNAPPCRRVIAYRAAGIRWLRLSTLRLKQSLHFPSRDFFFFFVFGTISKLTDPAKKLRLPNHNCHE